MNQKHWGEYNCPASMLVEITLGCQIAPDDERNVVEANQERKYPAKLFRATKKQNEIALDRVKI